MVPGNDPPATTTPRRVRSDATRNRAAIVAAATTAFAETGHAVNVRQIAERAGVGIGTVYRHFPTKHDLLDTIVHEQFRSWAHTAAVTADTHADPWDALVGFLDDALTRQACQLAVCERLTATFTEPDARWVTELLPIIDELVSRCHHQGRLAAGVDAHDIAVLLVGLGHAARITEPQHPRRRRRLLQLTLHGIAACDPGASDVPVSGS